MRIHLFCTIIELPVLTHLQDIEKMLQLYDSDQ